MDFLRSYFSKNEPDQLNISWTFFDIKYRFSCNQNIGVNRVSVQGVESLWGDCRFIPVDLGS